MDHPTTRKILVALLAKLGRETDVIGSESAIAAAIENSYDSILIDLQLEESNGLQICRQIRREEERNQSLIIALGACDSDEDRTRCVEAGADDYLVKPIRKSELEQALEKGSLDPDTSERAESLDLQRLDTLRSLEKQVGQVVVEPMVSSFIESAATELATIREAVADHNWSRLQSVAHALAGKALNLGAVGVGAICREIERQAPERSSEDLEYQIQALESELDKVSTAFGEYLAQSG